MDNTYLNNSTKSNPLLQNIQINPSAGRVAPPLPRSNVQVSTTLSTPSTTTTNAPQINYRNVAMPMSYMPSTVGATYNNPYGGYPYSRSFMNMNGFNPYSSFGQSMPNQYQNPVIIAAAENSRPAFESIQSVVQSFNAVSMMLESTFTAMHMSFQALLGVAENFTRLRTFLMKLYSTIVTFKLARWFLAKLIYLLRLVKGNYNGSSIEEDLWSNLSTSSRETTNQADGRSWPLIVFTGLLVATPYFVYKLLNSVTPTNIPNSVNGNNGRIVIKAPCDWSSNDPNTITLVKDQSYFTSNIRLENTSKNGGWLLLDSFNGQRGYAPFSLLKRNQVNKLNYADIPNVPPEFALPSMNEQIPPQIISTRMDNIKNDQSILDGLNKN
ncbi:peroxisomal membrane protein PEX13 isoform X2 [Daktulosphaira vitifoliae]|uniref:peroxisomal membrane protein PEX13 isoform X2 n=1 Tax=Daktulosphaira vitifoliae TaxID=58002 RepID=UPI0021AAD72B|nr:peroxisomal membrane protein PEX13 isoform X2 [Daktulosphaira vitifoliae]